MADELDRPESSDQLYIERGDPVPPWRPILTGDVFRDLPIPGLEESAMTMVIAHPCTMRAGSALRARLQVVPVRPHQRVPVEQWPSGYRKVFPLLDLGIGEPSAARLDEFGRVRSDQFDLRQRVACLSEDGIRFLMQRFFACFARVVVRLDTIGRALAPPLQEAELLEEWNERLAAARVEDGTPLEEALTTEAAEFDRLLSRTDDGQSSPLRSGLGDPVSATGVRRRVRDEINARAESRQ